MWDLDGTVLADGHIANYEPFIAKIAQLTNSFGKPVLLINGDSHKYRSDNPLQKNAPCAIEKPGNTTQTERCTDDNYDTHPNYPGEWPNFHRLVVHGATFPLQYTRLAVNARELSDNGHELRTVTLGPRDPMRAFDATLQRPPAPPQLNVRSGGQPTTRIRAPYAMHPSRRLKRWP